MESFLGIRHAQPPTGRLRWAPPKPVKPWTGVRSAEAYGNRCPALPSTNGPRSLTEDCLFLNVQRRQDPIPRIVVTLNYRLGVLGFLAHPALTAAQGESRNYGFMDQQQAAKREGWRVVARAGAEGRVAEQLLREVRLPNRLRTVCRSVRGLLGELEIYRSLRPSIHHLHYVSCMKTA